MGHINIQRTDLDTDQVFTIFQNGLSSRFAVHRSALPAIDFIVRKSALVGVGVKLQNKGGQARLRCGAMVPSTLLRMLTLNGLVSSILMWPVLRRTLREVEQFASSSEALSSAGSLDPATIAPGQQTTVASPPDPKGPKPAFVAAWIGLTALMIPTIVSAIFGYPGLVLDRYIVGQAAIAAVFALVGQRLLPMGLGRRPVLIGLLAWTTASLATSTYGYGPRFEFESWLSSYGAVEFAVVTASLLLLSRISGRRDAQLAVASVSTTA